MSDLTETDFPPLDSQPFVTEEGREIQRLRAELAAAKQRVAVLERELAVDTMAVIAAMRKGEA